MSYKKIVKVTKVLDKYFNEQDFTNRVIVNLADYSKLSFNTAFYIKLLNYYIIFTECWGQFIYSTEEVLSIRQFK